MIKGHQRPFVVLLILGSFGLYSPWIYLVRAQTSSPRITCVVANCLNANRKDKANKKCEVSSADFIRLSVKLKFPGVSPQDLRTNVINPRSPIPGAYYLLKLRSADGSDSPLKVEHVDLGINIDQRVVLIAFTIPEEDGLRRKKLRDWWTKRKATFVADESTLAARTNMSDASVIDLFDESLVDNRLGEYTLMLSYVSNNLTSRVEANSIDFSVIAKHIILDLN